MISLTSIIEALEDLMQAFVDVLADFFNEVADSFDKITFTHSTDTDVITTEYLYEQETGEG